MSRMAAGNRGDVSELGGAKCGDRPGNVVLLLAFDKKGNEILSQTLTVEDYYRFKNDLLASSDFRLERGIVKLRGRILSEDGQLLSEFEVNCDELGAFEIQQTEEEPDPHFRPRSPLIGRRKAICWFMLACGSIGLLLSCVTMIAGPSFNIFSVWLTLSLTACALSCLGALYRKEPRLLRGRWQLSLMDLIGVALASGAFIACWQTISSTAYAIPLGLLSGFALLGGLLVAARIGFHSGPWKFAFAAGHVLRIAGLLGTALFADVFVTECFSSRGLSRMGSFLYSVFVCNTSLSEFLVWPMRVGFGCLVPGMFLCHMALRNLPAPSVAEDKD